MLTKAGQHPRVERLLDAPIITPDTHPSIGTNIQGPSLIRVPDWVTAPLGRYYLYFADHKGRYIRLAHANELTGPWTVHPPGSLHLDESRFPSEPPEAPPGAVERIRAYLERSGAELPHDLVKELTTPHIASPDVHVDDAGRRIVMYFHGLEGFARQVTRVATSTDGVRFEARPEILGKTYLRAFRHHGHVYGLAMPGQLYRSKDGLWGFEEGSLLFEENMRHAALLKRGEALYVFWTRVGDAPERILVSTIDLSPAWEAWFESDAVELLRPERPWEGADAPLEPSVRSVAYGHVNQLRDPAIFVEDGRVFLLYAVAGESGIAIAELHFPPMSDSRADAVDVAGRSLPPGLPLSTSLVYALPNAGTGFAFFMVSIFFLKYATDVLAISAVAMGWILLAARLWDAVSDPVMGFLSDRTRTRLGRRRPWMIASALPLGLLIVALWSPPASLGGAALAAWTGVVFLLLYSATTAFLVPYDALGAELTSDYRERTLLFGLRRVTFGVGALAALGGVALLSRDDLATEAGRLAARATAFEVALLAAFLMAGLAIFAAARLRERPDYLERGARHPLRAFGDVWRNRRARILVIVFAVQQLGVTCIILVAPFFIDYVLQAPGQVAAVILAFMLSGTLSIPVWMAAGRRYEKKSLIIVAMVVISLAMLPGLFIGPGDLWIALPAVAIAGFAGGGTDTVFPSLQADVIDFDEHDSGERKEGTYFAVWAFAAKTASGGAGVLVGFALDAAGYVPNQPQTEASVAAIRLLYAGVPLVLWTASILVFRRFELTGAQHREIRSIIDARTSGVV